MSKYLFRIGTCKWKAISHKNVIYKGVDSCHKIIMIEKNDEIVEVHSSLMTGVAREIYSRSKHKFTLTSKFIESMKFVTNLEHDIFTILEFQQNDENITSENLDQT